jgi:hypothetical protein
MFDRSQHLEPAPHGRPRRRTTATIKFHGLTDNLATKPHGTSTPRGGRAAAAAIPDRVILASAGSGCWCRGVSFEGVDDASEVAAEAACGVDVESEPAEDAGWYVGCPLP